MCWGQLGVALHGQEALCVVCPREGPGTHPVRGAKGCLIRATSVVVTLSSDPVLTP